MLVDGREVRVSGNLLQPLIRRTNDMLRVALSGSLLAVVITSSLITRTRWDGLEMSISHVVGVLTPTQSDVVYLVYGLAVLALPFMILFGLIIARQGRLLIPYAAAAALSILALSISGTGIAAPQWHFDLSDRLRTVLSQFLDDPRWIGMLAAVLTVSGPWLPARWRRWWWALLLAFIPIHLVVSAVVPARSLLGIAAGWFVGGLVILVSGTPALEVPLDGAVRAMAKRGFPVTCLRVLRPAGSGPLILAAITEDSDENAVVEMYGPHQRSGGALRQVWRILRLRDNETAPLQASMRRAVEHRALMAIAIGELGIANTTTIAVGTLDRGWTLYAHKQIRGEPLNKCHTSTPVAEVWESLRKLQKHQIAHGDLRNKEITVSNGAVFFGGFGSAEYGATDNQLQADIAQLLVTTSSLYGADEAVAAAIAVLGRDTVLSASRRLTKTAVPKHIRSSVNDAKAVISRSRAAVMRQTGTEKIQPEAVTRFSRSQLIQLLLLGALVYVAYPFISTVPTFFNALGKADWWWALLGLAISASTYVGAAAALWASADESVNFWRLSIAQVANTFAATTTPAGVGGLALSTRILQKSGLSTTRATTAVALQQSMQVIMHVLLLIFFSTAAGAGTDLSHFVPKSTMLYLIAGAALGLVGVFLLIPNVRRWLSTAVTPKLKEIVADIIEVAREPKRMALIVLGCSGTTLGAALALWTSVAAFGGNASFVTVTVVTMVGGTLASAAPTPGGVGAVEAALIGGLAAFGVPAAVSVPSVLLYRVLTCWLPVFIGWPVMHWLTRNDMV
ncbi:lysylphosphatidylglycerol synthase transmembrane domain-containing protein [Mycobacterium sp.]|uniref:lysylphosphatidylglycerol synthase transmembrane domain-containing protein n=2 Tax=Mycobacterium sp. TaxID=1785 RepID=UPI0031E0B283